jgi:hypothetical protein
MVALGSPTDDLIALGLFAGLIVFALLVGMGKLFQPPPEEANNS